MTNFFCVVCRTAKEYLCIFEGNTMCNTCLDIVENERKKQQKRSNPKTQAIIDNKYSIQEEVKSNK
jgi:hypothetical protein